MFRQVLESLKCLESGVLRSVNDGNVGSILGIGAPVWTGASSSLSTPTEAARFVDRCQQLAERYGERFSLPQLPWSTRGRGEWIN